MAKRKRSRARDARPAGTSPAGADTGVDPDGSPSHGGAEEPDPLRLPAWPTASCPEEEQAERERFEHAWEAFVRGDFLECRRLARGLAEKASSDEVRLRALALLARLRPDPLAIAVAAGAFLLLLIAVTATFA